MLIVKTPPIMAACPRGGFTRSLPGGGLPFPFSANRTARAEFLFLRPPLKRRRIETLHPPPPRSSSPSFQSLSLSLSHPRFSRPLSPRHSSPLFISSSTVPSFVPFDRRDPSTSLPPRPPSAATLATPPRIRVGLTGWRRDVDAALEIHEEAPMSSFQRTSGDYVA